MTNLTFALPTTLLGALCFFNAPAMEPVSIAPQEAKNRLTQDQEAVDEVSVAYFQPQNMDAGRLSSLAQRLIFSAGVVGDVQGSGMFQAVTFETLGSTILVAAEADLMERVLGLLRDLDDGDTTARGDGSNDATRVTTFQYRLRFASPGVAEVALRPFMNFGARTQGFGSVPDAPTSVTIEYETGSVIVRETVPMIAEIRRVLEQIDQPEPQVRMTYYLVRGVDAETMESEGIESADLDQGLPADLVRDLGAILPVEGFQTLSFGVLQGDAMAERQVTDTLADGSQFMLGLQPTTFDRESGVLGLEQMNFEFNQQRSTGGFDMKRFRTSAQLEPGRFTVLGGVGATPVFLVLHMQRM
ncbi:Bacterial type II/III secretion system short domain protein [Planctomycetes bacterium Pla163]|uniref:Bacterial type II/III secretion system short domain protein n=1 Tax=Rohdeia mirabilis TaxID=2528008 RepID=A0A518CW37_9BACT|nr:Bacterial type II/III secretion system short domain protein [Planctomycetes bacterium Pla163]